MVAMARAGWEANLETEGKRIPFRMASSVMYDARLHQQLLN